MSPTTQRIRCIQSTLSSTKSALSSLLITLEIARSLRVDGYVENGSPCRAPLFGPQESNWSPLRTQPFHMLLQC